MNKVVIVEDEEFIRKGMVLATPWSKFNCEVIGEAKNGVEGLELIKKIKPDIVITDVKMPIMDGIIMIKELKNYVDSEYIIISGYDDFKYAQQAIKLGVKDYLLKPIDDNEFYNTLNKVIDIVKQKKEKMRISNSKAKVELFNEYTYEKGYDSREKYIIKAVEYIKNNYNQEIVIKEVAESLFISESYLSRLFKKYTGYTFVEYLTNYRVKKAIELLKDHTIKVYEVAEKVGYNDSKYFSVIFKKYMGVTPIEFKLGLKE